MCCVTKLSSQSTRRLKTTLSPMMQSTEMEQLKKLKRIVKGGETATETVFLEKHVHTVCS